MCALARRSHVLTTSLCPGINQSNVLWNVDTSSSRKLTPQMSMNTCLVHLNLCSWVSQRYLVQQSQTYVRALALPLPALWLGNSVFSPVKWGEQSWAYETLVLWGEVWQRECVPHTQRWVVTWMGLIPTAYTNRYFVLNSRFKLSDPRSIFNLSVILVHLPPVRIKWLPSYFFYMFLHNELYLFEKN